jgi:glutathione S-transferase
VICEYLDGLGGAPRLFPAAGPARIEALRRHALGNGAMDFLLLWRGELARPAPDQRILDGFVAKQAAVLAALEAEAAALSAGAFDIGRVAIGCALSYLDFRWPEAGWRPAHPGLAAWHAGFAARPSVRATEHVDA